MTPNTPQGGDIDLSLLTRRYALNRGQPIAYKNPFLVLVTSDCRDEESEGATGQVGICLGRYNEDELQQDEEGNILSADLSQRTEDEENGVPLIQLNDGIYIWGSECWWEPIYKGEKIDLLGAQERLVELVTAILDDLENGLD